MLRRLKRELLGILWPLFCLALVAEVLVQYDEWQRSPQVNQGSVEVSVTKLTEQGGLSEEEDSSVTHVSEPVEQDMTAVAAEMRRRVDTLQQACLKSWSSSPSYTTFHWLQKVTPGPHVTTTSESPVNIRVNPWEYFVDRKHRLVWCNVFKSGSSSWAYVFDQLGGVEDSDLEQGKKPLITLARSIYRRPSEEELLEASEDPQVVTFIVGRHPFQRLVSGYRDKIASAFRGSYHHRMGKTIMEMYGTQGPKAKSAVKMHLGIGHVVHYFQCLHRRRKVVTQYPTFQQFVRYVLDQWRSGAELDMHWAPVHSFCDVCGLFNFTAVVKLETFDRDQKFVLRSAGLRFKGDGGPSGDGVDELILKLRHVNEAIASRKSGETLAAEYMRQLGPEQIQGLCELYRLDFELFGYVAQECQQ